MSNIIKSAFSIPDFLVSTFCKYPHDKEYNPAPIVSLYRSDFELNGNLTYLLVEFCLQHNPESPDTIESSDSDIEPSTESFELAVKISDLHTNEIIASTLHADTMMHNDITFVELSLPINSRLIDPSHEFIVEVVDASLGDTPSEDHVLASQTIHFFCPNKLGVDPANWYRPISGWLTDLTDLFLYPKKTLGRADLDEIAITFKLETLLDDLEILPEVEIHLLSTDPNLSGQRLVEICRPTRSLKYTDDNDEPALIAEAKFDVSYFAPCNFLTELWSMGHKIGSFVFSSRGSYIIDVWDEEFFVNVDASSPAAIDKACNEILYPYNLDESAIEEEEEDDVFSTDDDYDNEEDCDEQSTDTDYEPIQTAYIPSSSEVDKAPELTIDDMVGLKQAKAKLNTYTSLVEFNAKRKEANLSVINAPLHSILLGNPGTGKTTFARLLGKRLHEIGVLSKGHVVVCERSTLCGTNYCSESVNLQKALKDAQGGILFIDEAYQLYQPHDPKDPGRFVIESLLTALSDESMSDWALVMSGYTQPMLRLLECNEGLKSRIPESNMFVFEDYTVDELMEIATNYFNRYNFKLDDEAHQKLLSIIRSATDSKDETFGNARFITILINNEIIPAMAVRLSAIPNPTPDDLSIITAADIPTNLPRPILKLPNRHSPRVGFTA